MFDKRRFKAAVVLKGYTFADVAKILEIDISTLHRKMNGESDFYRAEIQTLCNALDIEDPQSIFFAQQIT